MNIINGISKPEFLYRLILNENDLNPETATFFMRLFFWISLFNFTVSSGFMFLFLFAANNFSKLLLIATVVLFFISLRSLYRISKHVLNSVKYLHLCLLIFLESTANTRITDKTLIKNMELHKEEMYNANAIFNKLKEESNKNT